MSWGDHDTEKIKAKLNVEARSNQLTKEQERYLFHQKDNLERNLGYRDRDWFNLGWNEGAKNPVTNKVYKSKNNFARNLKLIRTAFGFTMDDLHKSCGVAMQTIGKYEAGDTEPSVSNLIKLAESLNVSIEYLVCAELKLEVKEM